MGNSEDESIQPPQQLNIAQLVEDIEALIARIGHRPSGADFALSHERFTSVGIDTADPEALYLRSSKQPLAQPERSEIEKLDWYEIWFVDFNDGVLSKCVYSQLVEWGSSVDEFAELIARELDLSEVAVPDDILTALAAVAEAISSWTTADLVGQIE